MELTRVTKLLLWLLSKRPDIDNIGIHEADPTDYLQDLDDDELYGDLDQTTIQQLHVDFLNDCLTKSDDS
jgi:hypothetical protein